MNKTQYNRNDLKSFLIHDMLLSSRQYDHALVEKARAIALRWLAMHGEDYCPYWRSWLNKLDSLSWDEFCDFALGDSDASIAHRQSSPFSCCLSTEQKKELKEALSNETHRS